MVLLELCPWLSQPVLGPDQQLANGINTAVTLSQGMQCQHVARCQRARQRYGYHGLHKHAAKPGRSRRASGTQHLSLYTVTGTTLNQSLPDTVDYIYPGKHSSQHWW